jgi:hypothetical protein
MCKGVNNVFNTGEGLPGIVNTGGGGGGPCIFGVPVHPDYNGGAGGSGIVILWY